MSHTVTEAAFPSTQSVALVTATMLMQAKQLGFWASNLQTAWDPPSLQCDACGKKLGSSPL
jgi:hypothetical protein